jgi:hypothetical protein
VTFKSCDILVAAPSVRNCATRRSGKWLVERGAGRRRICAEEQKASVKAEIFAGNPAGDLSE